MRQVRNTTRRPLRVPLSGGRVLHLGPAATGQVADDTLERPSFRKLVESGEIELLDGERADSFDGQPRSRPREETQGHQPPTMVMPKGNR